VRLEFGVVCTRSGETESSSILARFDDIRIYGTGRNPSSFPVELNLRGTERGKYELTTNRGNTASSAKPLPVILMPSGEESQYEVRYDKPGTPESVAQKVRMCLDLANRGLIDGVVPYRLKLQPNDGCYEAIRREYTGAAPSETPVAKPVRKPSRRPETSEHS
jgi:hypothetical protein